MTNDRIIGDGPQAVTHGTGGFMWTTGEDSPPPHAIPIKDWTIKYKDEPRVDPAEEWLRSRPISGLAGSISGLIKFDRKTLRAIERALCGPRRVPGSRKVGRMQKRGY